MKPSEGLGYHSHVVEIVAPQLEPCRSTGFLRSFVLSAAVAASLILLMLVLPLGAAGYITESFAGTAVICVYGWRSFRDCLAAACLGLAFAAVYFLSGAAIAPWTGWAAVFPAALFGMGHLVVLAYRCSVARGSRQKDAMDTFRTATLLPALCLFSIIGVWAAIRITPRTYDWSLYAFDRSLGFSPSAFAGQLWRAHPILRFAAGLAYSSLPVNIGLAFALWSRRKSGIFPDVRVLFVLLGVAGFLLYQLCPAAGPVYLGGSAFPDHLPLAGDALKSVVIPDAPRNAMPSLHIAMCLLILYNTWFGGLKWRLYGFLCLLLTAIATLGTGEHYLIDLVVAVPLSAAVQMACSPRRDLGSAGILLGLVIGWLVTLRAGGAVFRHPLAIWAALLTTLILPALLFARSMARRPGMADNASFGLFRDNPAHQAGPLPES